MAKCYTLQCIFILFVTYPLQKPCYFVIYCILKKKKIVQNKNIFYGNVPSHKFFCIILPIEYNKILDQPGDSLYMRAMFDRDQEQDGELSFKKTDILYVDNTMFNGKRGTWRAWLVDDEGSKLRCGTIPSKSRYVSTKIH